MKNNIEPKCGRCQDKKCRTGKDCFSQADEHKQLYQNKTIEKLHKTAACIEGQHYGKEPRLSETILFAKEFGCKKIGLAFCVGLSEEAMIIESIFAKHFNVISACCKMCGINKKDFGLHQIIPEKEEIMCNPAGQAQLLNDSGTDLNVICGLCVGHDAIFSKVSQAPVTTLISKDRVLAHNPIGAVYSQYIRKRFN